MTLPIVLLKSEERWDCHQCGFCCRGSLVHLSSEDADRLRAQKWEEQPEYKNTAIMVRDRHAASGFRLAHRGDGSCVFLQSDGLCHIHAKFGLAAKPTLCQTFPMQLIPPEKHAVLTIRRACPSAAADLGTAVKNRLPLVKQLIREERWKAEPVKPPHLKKGEKRDWPTTRLVLETVRDLLQDQRYPPVRRLVHALQFAGHLEAAKTTRLNNAQMVELSRTLADLAPDEASPFFAERRPPKAHSKVMFRIMAIMCARIHPQAQHQSNWKARCELGKMSLRILRGSGKTPSIDAVFPQSTFADLENPLGVLRPDVYLPLNRLIETTSESFLYALANRRDWSIVESVRGLAVLFPIGMWLLRWAAHGREPTVQDMLHIVVALDRSQGYASHNGYLHRQQLSLLSFNQELERLVIWYAR